MEHTNVSLSVESSKQRPSPAWSHLKTQTKTSLQPQPTRYGCICTTRGQPNTTQRPYQHLDYVTRTFSHPNPSGRRNLASGGAGVGGVSGGGGRSVAGGAASLSQPALVDCQSRARPPSGQRRSPGSPTATCTWMDPRDPGCCLPTLWSPCLVVPHPRAPRLSA